MQENKIQKLFYYTNGNLFEDVYVIKTGILIIDSNYITGEDINNLNNLLSSSGCMNIEQPFIEYIKENENNICILLVGISLESSFELISNINNIRIINLYSGDNLYNIHEDKSNYLQVNLIQDILKRIDFYSDFIGANDIELSYFFPKCDSKIMLIQTGKKELKYKLMKIEQPSKLIINLLNKLD